MINEAPLARFAPLAGGLLKPIYADYSFANIANTIEHLLTGAEPGPLLPADCFGGTYPRPRKVVTFFVELVRLGLLEGARRSLSHDPRGHGEGRAHTDLRALSLDHRRVGLHAESRGSHRARTHSTSGTSTSRPMAK